MKKLLTIAILVLSITASAQTIQTPTPDNIPEDAFYISGGQAKTTVVKPLKQLPPTITVTMTAKEFLRLDTAVNTIARQLDSKSFESWYRASFYPIYKVVEKQLIPADTTKKK